MDYNIRFQPNVIHATPYASEEGPPNHLHFNHLYRDSSMPLSTTYTSPQTSQRGPAASMCSDDGDSQMPQSVTTFISDPLAHLVQPDCVHQSKENIDSSSFTDPSGVSCDGWTASLEQN